MPDGGAYDGPLGVASSFIAIDTARSAATLHDAVATFGKVRAVPNGANAIPSEVLAWIDAR